MVFSSLLFLLLFFPIQLGVYYIVPKKARNYVLLAFSLIFYAWSGPFYVFLLMGESLVSYFCAKKIDECQMNNLNKDKGYLILGCVVLLGALVFFKYLSFLAGIINSLLGLGGLSIPVPDILLPIGISFYTFQLLSYLADVYWGKVRANTSYFELLLYAASFHQCIAGPIVRYETVAREIEDRSVTVEDFRDGIVRFSTGLFKKAVLANGCAKVSDAVFASGLDTISAQTTMGVWIGAVFFTLQIFLDFSAYSDMAIGMGRMVGFHYLENFNYPYISGSVTEFWRRWHISLSSFFRDYVYIPLGGNRVNAARHILNLFIVWFLTGLWHGAAVNYILWGLYYFAFLMIEKYIIGKMQNMTKKAETKDTDESEKAEEEKDADSDDFDIEIIDLKTLRSRDALENKNEDKSKEKNKSFAKIFLKILSHILTLLIVIVGWVIFKCEDTKVLLLALSAMFGQTEMGFWSLQNKTTLLGNIFLLLFSAFVSTPILRNVYMYLKKSKHNWSKNLYAITEIVLPIILLIISVCALTGNSYNPFLYFRF